MIAGVIGIFFIGILSGIILLFFSHSLDRRRVRNYIGARGGKVISQYWAPFGKGWMGDESNAIYNLVYEDMEGNLHKALVKTSLFSSVYLSDDQIIDKKGY